MEDSRVSSAASPRMGRWTLARSATLTSTRRAWISWCGRASGRMNLRQTTHRPWPRAAVTVLLQPQSLQVSLAPLRCGWGPARAQHVK